MNLSELMYVLLFSHLDSYYMALNVSVIPIYHVVSITKAHPTEELTRKVVITDDITADSAKHDGQPVEKEKHYPDLITDKNLIPDIPAMRSESNLPSSDNLSTTQTNPTHEQLNHPSIDATIIDISKLNDDTQYNKDAPVLDEPKQVKEMTNEHVQESKETENGMNGHNAHAAQHQDFRKDSNEKVLEVGKETIEIKESQEGLDENRVSVNTTVTDGGKQAQGELSPESVDRNRGNEKIEAQTAATYEKEQREAVTKIVLEGPGEIAVEKGIGQEEKGREDAKQGQTLKQLEDLSERKLDPSRETIPERPLSPTPNNNNNNNSPAKEDEANIAQVSNGAGSSTAQG